VFLGLVVELGQKLNFTFSTFISRGRVGAWWLRGEYEGAFYHGRRRRNCKGKRQIANKVDPRDVYSVRGFH
jgi:hypothetical protein